MDNKFIKVKDIPLKIRKPKKEIDNNETITLLVMAILLLIVTSFLIFCVLYDKEELKLIDSPTIQLPIIDKSNILYNKWKTDNNSLFVFGADNNFTWYERYNNLTNNYFTGTYTYVQHNKALVEMGYSEEEFNKTFPNITNLNNVYSLKLFPTKYVKNKIDRTKDTLRDNETWWLIILIDDNNNVIAYNKTLDERYILTMEP